MAGEGCSSAALFLVAMRYHEMLDAKELLCCYMVVESTQRERVRLCYLELLYGHFTDVALNAKRYPLDYTVSNQFPSFSGCRTVH